ncbi:MAG TPA: TetR family transcriptional regulator [Amycolatopsis sp.]|nr:TetR family transcriptional regulator [Amycolatopsis sp.]
MTAVKNRRQEYKELTRAALLSAASEQFAGRGFSATSVDHIAAAARVSKGTVYHHFTDKAELFEAVFRDRQQRLLTDVARASGRHRGPWAQFEAALDAYLRSTVADPIHRALLREAPTALGTDRCRQIDEELGLPVVLATLTALDEAGELSQPVTEILARVLFAALCEAAMAAGANPDPRAALRDAAAALRTITAGLRRARS